MARAQILACYFRLSAHARGRWRRGRTVLPTRGEVAPKAPEALPAGHRRHDRDLVLLGDLRAQPGPESNVLVVQVHVDELPQLPALVKQPVAETGRARVQRLDRRRQVRGLDVHSHLPIRQAPERTGDSKLSHDDLNTHLFAK